MVAIQVSEKDLAQFEMAVAIACVRKSEKPLEYQRPTNIDRTARDLPSCFTHDGCVAISFDRSWNPFLCNTGDDERPSRWFIPKTSWLIAAVARALQTPMQRAISFSAGGRILLDATGGRRQPEGHAEIAVVQWSLPRESPLLPTR